MTEWFARFRSVRRALHGRDQYCRFRFESRGTIDSSMYKQPNVHDLSDAVARWLRIQLTGAAAQDESSLPDTVRFASSPERFHALGAVVRNDPELAARSACIGLFEQLRLSVELVGAQPSFRPQALSITPVANFARCRPIHRNRRRA
jgi:hypothetical protein